MDRKKWVALRRLGLGGTDAAAVCGLSPFRSEMDVYLNKKGMDNEWDDPDKNFLLDLGLQLEPIIARLYERATGRELMMPPANLLHPEHPELRGSPDRMVQGELRGVELKTENRFTDEFGAPGSDEVPKHYLIQCAHYMALTGAFHWDIAVLHGATTFAIYTVQRDAELESLLIERLTTWWHDHIVLDIPPDVDSSDAWKVYLHKKFPRNVKPIEEIAPGNAYLVGELGEIHRAQKAIERMRQEVENKLKGIVGDRDGLTSKYGRVTWKNTRDSDYIDYQAAFHILAEATHTPKDVANGILQSMTETKKGVRRFLFTPAKGMDDANEFATRTNQLPAIAGEAQSGDSQSTTETPDSGSHGTDSVDLVPPRTNAAKV